MGYYYACKSLHKDSNMRVSVCEQVWGSKRASWRETELLIKVKAGPICPPHASEHYKDSFVFL